VEKSEWRVPFEPSLFDGLIAAIIGPQATGLPLGSSLVTLGNSLVYLFSCFY